MVFVVSDTNKATYCFSQPALQAGGRGFESRHVHQLYFFQRNSFDVFFAYHLLFRQGVAGSNRLASINLILAAITYYTALLVHYFGAPSGHSGQSCPLGRRASTISLRLFERRDALLADHAGAARSTLRPQLRDCPSSDRDWTPHFTLQCQRGSPLRRFHYQVTVTPQDACGEEERESGNRSGGLRTSDLSLKRVSY